MIRMGGVPLPLLPPGSHPCLLCAVLSAESNPEHFLGGEDDDLEPAVSQSALGTQVTPAAPTASAFNLA